MKICRSKKRLFIVNAANVADTSNKNNMKESKKSFFTLFYRITMYHYGVISTKGKESKGNEAIFSEFIDLVKKDFVSAKPFIKSIEFQIKGIDLYYKLVNKIQGNFNTQIIPGEDFTATYLKYSENLASTLTELVEHYSGKNKTFNTDQLNIIDRFRKILKAGDTASMYTHFSYITNIARVETNSNAPKKLIGGLTKIFEFSTRKLGEKRVIKKVDKEIKADKGVNKPPLSNDEINQLREKALEKQRASESVKEFNPVVVADGIRTILKKVAKEVKAIFGRENYVFLTREDIIKIEDSIKFYRKEGAEENATAYEQWLVWYKKVIRSLYHVSKPYITNYIIANGNTQVDGSDIAIDAKQLFSHLTEIGIISHPFPKAFEGFIDASGRLYTKTGNLIDGVPTAGVVISMNKNYNAADDDVYVFSAEGGQANLKLRKHWYTVNYKKNTRNPRKKDPVMAFIENAATYVNKWRSDMLSTNDLVKHKAAMLEFVFITAGRIGSNSKSASQGISTLKFRNVTPISSGYRFEYTIKGVPQKHDITLNTKGYGIQDKALRSLLTIIHTKYTDFKENNRDPEEWLWESPNKGTGGKTIRISPPALTQYMKQLSFPEGFTMHKFRNLRGTMVFLKQSRNSPLHKLEKPVPDKDFKKEFDRITTEVGRELGHVTRSINVATGEVQQKTSNINAIGSYIEPSVMIDFYNEFEKKIPRALEKAYGLTAGEALGD